MKPWDKRIQKIYLSNILSQNKWKQKSRKEGAWESGNDGPNPGKQQQKSQEDRYTRGSESNQLGVGEGRAPKVGPVEKGTPCN